MGRDPVVEGIAGRDRGDELWERIMAAGEPYGIAPGHTSSIRRIEGAMLSYHADADIHTNPYELGLGRLVDLDMEADFIGKQALKKIRAKGVHRKQVGLELQTDPLRGPNTRFWPIAVDGEFVGKVTSAVYSPRLEKNIALAMLTVEHAEVGTRVDVEMFGDSDRIGATVVDIPFFDPKKQIANG